MSYSINKWDSVVNKYNRLSPIIYFKVDADFLEASRRNSNFLQIKISNTASIYDQYKYIFATVDKSPVEGYYCMTLEVPFTDLPLINGKFEINKGEYTAPQSILSTSDGVEEPPTPSPDYSKQNEEAYNKIMNAVKVVTAITIIASAAAVSMSTATTTAATDAVATTNTTKGASKLPIAGVGFSARSKSGGEATTTTTTHPTVVNSVFEKTKEIFISVMIFLVIGFVISTLFGVKPNLNFSA